MHAHLVHTHPRSVLLSNSTGELVFGVLACPSEAGPTLTNYATYLIGFATLAAIPLQIVWVNKGLMYFEVQLIMPIFASGTVIITVLGGSIFFQEFRSFCAWQYVAYFAGLVPRLAETPCPHSQRPVAQPR